MKIISNTGPIIGLAKIDLLSILEQIASEVFIPPMVYRELQGKIGIESERIDKALAEFIAGKRKRYSREYWSTYRQSEKTGILDF